MRQKQRIDSHYLTNSTLIQHVGRLYLDGCNSFTNPWSVPTSPPEELIPLIYIPEYEIFRDELNAKLAYHVIGDTLTILLFSLLFPPLGIWFLRKIRREKATLFENYIAQGIHFFLKGPRAQALLECIKCGYDDHCTVAYIDILYNENAPAPEGMIVGSPTLPLLLPLSGEGTRLHPYTIDLSDVLVSSVPNCKDLHKFIDKEYVEFLSQLNRSIRSLPPISIHSREDVTEVRVPVYSFL